MLPSAPASSISTNRQEGLRLALGATVASCRAMQRERLHAWGLTGYIAIWVLTPALELGIVAIIYGGARPDLLRYTVVAVSANALIFSTIYHIGEILDSERVKGTLVGLFLAPCPRISWLTGCAVAGLGETAMAATAGLLFGRFALGVRFDPNWPAVVLTLGLFIAALWGLGLVFSAIGLMIKKANQLSNLIYPFATLLGGVFYPVALLPDPLRVVARALPLGYGMEALANAALYGAGIRALAPQLVPLAGFAVALPFAGALAFGWLERLVRRRGELDLY